MNTYSFVWEKITSIVFNNIDKIKEIFLMYNQSNRYYHNLDHIGEMLKFVEPYENSLSRNEFIALNLAIIFHDVVYNIHSKDNEEKSYELFLDFITNHNIIFFNPHINQKDKEEIIPLVKGMIMATKDHIMTDHVLNNIIINADLDRFNRPFHIFWQHNLDILKEYNTIEWSIVKNGRIEFLIDYVDKIYNIKGKHASLNCTLTANMLESYKPNIAIYPGSFNPFHIGHLDILNKANKIFDKVLIACGKNPDKSEQNCFIPDKIKNNFQIDEYSDDMITDYIQRKEYPVTIIRGLRDTNDLLCEMTTYRHWKDAMSNLNLVTIFSDASLSHVSSSAIRKTKDFYYRQDKQHPHEIL